MKKKKLYTKNSLPVVNSFAFDINDTVPLLTDLTETLKKRHGTANPIKLVYYHRTTVTSARLTSRRWQPLFNHIGEKSKRLTT